MPAVQVAHAEVREVAQHQRVGQVALGNAGEGAHGLVKRGLQRTPRDLCSTSICPGQNRSM